MSQPSSHSSILTSAIRSHQIQHLPDLPILAQSRPKTGLKKAPAQFALHDSEDEIDTDKNDPSDDESDWEDMHEDDNTILQITNHDCAIIDDDSSDWNDPPKDDKLFQRVESKGNLASRPSLIALKLAQNGRAPALDCIQPSAIVPQSQDTPHGSSASAVSPSDSDEGPLMMKGMRHPALKSISEVPRSVAQPIVVPTTHIHHQAAFSPRTTRRHMLATELTESLRRHLLWERKQKTSTADAVLQRRHDPQDISILNQSLTKLCLKKEEDENTDSWNRYINVHELNGYHSRGW